MLQTWLIWQLSCFCSSDTDGGVQGKSPFDSSKLEASKGLDEFETMTKYVQYLKEHGYFQPSWLNSVMSGYLENLKLGHDKNSEERQWLHAALHLSDLDTHKSPHESARRRRRRSVSAKSIVVYLGNIYNKGRSTF